MEASDIEGAASGTGGVIGESIEVTLGIGGATGASGTDSAGSSSYCLVCGGTGDAGLAGVATGAE